VLLGLEASRETGRKGFAGRQTEKKQRPGEILLTGSFSETSRSCSGLNDRRNFEGGAVLALGRGGGEKPPKKQKTTGASDPGGRSSRRKMEEKQRPFSKDHQQKRANPWGDGGGEK